MVEWLDESVGEIEVISVVVMFGVHLVVRGESVRVEITLAS